jgi:cell division protein ZapA
MSKNKVEVVIGGTIYALQGDEPIEHIQKVAAIIDKKILEIQHKDLSKRLNTSQTFMMSAINIADEYLKLQDELHAYELELDKCSRENMALLDRLEEMKLEINYLKATKK